MPATDWAAQVEAFEQQLRLAQELRRPVTVRRDAGALMVGLRG